MKSFVRISVLLWADILVVYALFVMQNYLTDVWNLSLTRAAGILNIWNGISMILPVFFLFLVDAYLGHFMMLVISSTAYSVGIGFVAMSTPPVIGTCKKYEPQCISDAQKVLFYIGMSLLAVGIAGHIVSVKPFFSEQQEKSGDNEETKKCLQVLGLILVVIVSIIGAIAHPYIKPWTLRFGIPAIFTAISTLLFLSGWRTYDKNEELQGSPITSVCRVFVAFAFKISKPFNAGELYKRNSQESFSHTRFLRLLEKAAIKLPDISEEDQVRKWKLCSVSEVEEAKIAVRMVPMWLTFIVCGIVSSFGNTYFIEQANHMNRKIGAWKVPLPVLLLLSGWAKNIYNSVAKCVLEKHKTYGPPVGIGIAMVFSILCCITAARIETKRLKVIRNHGLLDKPDEDIPMSVYWLLFQFFLLAGLDSFCEKSVSAFYADQGPDSMKNYLEHFSKAVFGLGFMCNVLSVFVVGKISEKGGKKKNWFQFTLSRSRLDRYYWVLAGLSSVNLLVFVVVAWSYRYKKRSVEYRKVDAEMAPLPSAPPQEAGEEEKEAN